LVPYLSDADIERIIYGPESRVIDLSVRARFFRGGLRRAIGLRDRWCTHPGCTKPAEDCQVDHMRPRSHGGATSQDNGRARCDTHNWWAWNHELVHHETSDDDGPAPPPVHDTG
jgi:hypothetical protein